MAGAAAGGAIRAGRAFVELFTDQTKLERGLKQASGKLKRWGASIRGLGQQTMRAGLAATAPFALSAVVFTRFSDAMLMVKGVTRATGAEFDLLKEKAKELGRTTSFTASQVAAGMLSLARGGFNPKEIDAGIAAVMDLARATGTDLAIAADMTATTLRAFGLEAGEVTRVVDTLVATANNSTQTLEDLGEAMEYSKVIARKLGLTVEDTAKILGTLALFGLRGSRAGTGLRRMMAALTETDTQETLRALNVEVLDLNRNVRNPADILQDLGHAMENMPSGERLAIARDLFDLRAMGAALSLAGNLGDSIDRMYAAIDNGAGIANATARTMDSAIGGAWRRLTSAAEGLAISIGEALEPSLISIGTAIKNLVTDITEFVENHQELVVALSAVAVAAIPLGGALVIVGAGVSALGTIVGGAAAVFVGLAGAITAVGGPFGLLGIGVAAAAAEAVGYMVWNKSLREELRGLATDTLTMLGQTWGETFAGMSDALATSDIIGAIKILRAGVKVEFLQLKDMLMSFWDELEATNDRVKLAFYGKLGLSRETILGSRADAEDPFEAMLRRDDELADARAELLKLLQKAKEPVTEAAFFSSVKDIGQGFKKTFEKLTGPKPESFNDLASRQIKRGAAGLGGILGTAINAGSGTGIGRMLRNAVSELMGPQQRTPVPGLLSSVGGALANTFREGANAIVALGRMNLGALAGVAADAVDGLELDAGAKAPLRDLAIGKEPDGGEARGALTSQAALRLSGLANISPAERTAKGVNKLVGLQQKGNADLAIIKALAKKAKLVFAG